MFRSAPQNNDNKFIPNYTIVKNPPNNHFHVMRE